MEFCGQSQVDNVIEAYFDFSFKIMNPKLVVLCLVFFQLYQTVRGSPFKRQRSLGVRNRTITPILVTPNGIKTTPVTTTAPKPEVVPGGDKVIAERDVSDGNQATPVDPKCAEEQKVKPRFQIEMDENDLSPNVTDPLADKPTEFIYDQHEYVELKPENTETPKKAVELKDPSVTATDMRNDYPLNNITNGNVVPDTNGNETTVVKSVLHTSVVTPNSNLTVAPTGQNTSNVNNTKTDVKNTTEKANNVGTRRFLTLLTNAVENKPRNRDDNDDVVIKDDFIKEIVERKQYPCVDNDKEKYQYSAKYVEAPENGALQEWDLPTYAINANQLNSLPNYQYIDSYSSPTVYNPANNYGNGYNLQYPYYPDYSNGLNYQKLNPAYDNVVQYDNMLVNMPDATGYNRQGADITYGDNQPARLDPVWDITAPGQPASIVVPLDVVDLEKLKGNHVPDLTLTPPPYKYPFEEALANLHLDDPYKPNSFNRLDTPIVQNLPKTLYQRRSNRPKIIKKYDPKSKYYFTEVEMPSKNLERIWRSWHKTEVLRKGGKGKVPIDSSKNETNRQSKPTRSPNRKRRIGTIDSYSNNANSKPWRTRLDYSPTVTK